MDGYLSVFLLSIGSALVACSLREYHIVNIPMGWHDAQQYCRQHYTDLATFRSIEEMQRLYYSLGDSWAWFGLHDNTSSWKGVMGKEPNSWRWSATGETSPGGYQVWAADEPNYCDRDETCVMMTANGEWQDKSCYTLAGFICFTESDSSPRSYEYISTPSTWAKAQAYCRQHHTDLAVIDGPEQNSNALSTKAPGSEAWIGLYRVPWAWSDQSLSSFTRWGSSSPNYPSVQHCVIMGKAFEFDDEYCVHRYAVVCQTGDKFGRKEGLIVSVSVFVLFFFSTKLSDPAASTHFPLRQYHIVNITMTWNDAQQYCRQHYSDLATFESTEEMQQLHYSLGDSWVWIGLHDDRSSWKGVMGKEPNSWRWSATGETSPGGFQAWAADEPNYLKKYETCVMMAANGEWQDKSCYMLTGFICFTESNSRSYEFISRPSTWAEAQAYCRQHHTDLAVIDGPEQNSNALSAKAPGSEAWIGLYRVPWAWSDQSLSRFRRWGNISPNVPFKQHCGVMHRVFGWDDDDCTVEYAVICQKDLTLQQSLMRVIMKSGADVTKLLNNDQILQKVKEVLQSHGLADVKLKWRIRPVKQTTEEKSDPHCEKNTPNKK